MNSIKSYSANDFVDLHKLTGHKFTEDEIREDPEFYNNAATKASACLRCTGAEKEHIFQKGNNGRPEFNCVNFNHYFKNKNYVKPYYKDGNLYLGQCEELNRVMETEYYKYWIQRADIGLRYKEATFKSYQPSNENKQAYEKAKRYSEEFTHDTSENIFISGSVGTGKTHLAVSILQEQAPKDISIKFYRVTELLNNLRNFDKGDEVLNKVKQTELIVLDDAGTENATDWAREQLYVIINHRYENLKPTIITSNIGPGELFKTIGERTVSRILENCTGIMLKGNDFRLTRGAKNEHGKSM